MGCLVAHTPGGRHPSTASSRCSSSATLTGTQSGRTALSLGENSDVPQALLRASAASPLRPYPGQRQGHCRLALVCESDRVLRRQMDAGAALHSRGTRGLVTTTDGKLRSVRRSSVNLEATERKWGIASAENRPRSITDRPNGSLSTGDRFPLRSTSLGTHTDYKLTFPIKRSQLKFSFARQRMDPKKLKNLKQLSEYLSGERNTLMQSSGTVPLLDNRLDGEVELGYSDIPGSKRHAMSSSV